MIKQILITISLIGSLSTTFAEANYCTGTQCPTPSGITALNKLCADIKNDASSIYSVDFTADQWRQVLTALKNAGTALKETGSYATECNFTPPN